MRRTHTVSLLAAIAAAGAAPAGLCAQADAPKPFAAIEATAGDRWTPGDRWKAEEVGGQQARRLTANVAYCRAEATGKPPTDGNVLLRVRYHSDGDSFFIGLGAWGSPTEEILPQQKGWQTGEVAFPAWALNRDLNDQGVGMLLRKTGQGPAIARIELAAASRRQVLEAFRRYVRQSTEKAYRMGRSGADGLTEVKDYDDAEPLAPTAEDRRRGAIPFLRSYLKYAYPASVPTQAERVTDGRVQLTPGEYEPFQLAVKALKDLPACRAALVGKPPRGLQGEICRVDSVPTRTQGGSRSKKWHVQPYRLWPEEIFPTCDVKAGDAQAWWIILKAAEDCKPGVHRLEVAVTSRGKPVCTFRLNVRVLPFTLPKRIGQAFLICEAMMVRNEALLKDLAEHGCNGLNAFNSFQPVRGGKVDFSVWDPYFATLKRHGLNECFFWYLGNPRSGNSVLKSVGKEAFVEILKGLNERVADGRYPKTFALSIDEAVLNSRAFSEFKQLSGLLRQHAPALKVQGTSLASHSYARRYEGLIDVLACNGSFAPNSAWCREKKVMFSVYGYVAARVSANSTRSLYGFHSWQHRAAGVNGWALRWYNGNAFNDLDAGVSDWGILLPNWLGRPISTPAWEGYREGVDDRRYLHVYEQLVKEGKAPDALLKEIREKGVGDMKVWVETVVGDSVFGAALKNATDLEIARERVVREILKAKGLK